MKKYAICMAAAVGILGAVPVQAANLLSVEFLVDNQAGFDIWPSAIPNGSGTISESFATDAVETSGTTTVTVTPSSSINNISSGAPANNPPNYTLQGLYADNIHAAGPTGFLTLDFSGLNANQEYLFTLYAFDDSATNAEDKVWTVTGGSGSPSSASVNFGDTLDDDDVGAMVFNITTTGTGTFQLTNTDGLPQSAINGFRLESIEAVSAPEPSAFMVAMIGLIGAMIWRRRR